MLRQDGDEHPTPRRNAIAAAAIVRSAAVAARLCAEPLARQFAAWPQGAGPCAGVVLGPGWRLFDGARVEAMLHALPDGFRCGVVGFSLAQALVAVEVIAFEYGRGDTPGAVLARTLQRPTGPGEFWCLVLLDEGAAVVPVTPSAGDGGGRA